VLEAPAGPAQFGRTLSLLNLTGAAGLDVVLSVPDAQQAEDRVLVVRGGERTTETLPGLEQTIEASTPDGRGVRGDAIVLGRRAGD
jgi:hypothetical protein